MVGLPATLVSLAIMMALLLDAFIDPLVGQFSDRTRTRLGRRHPWLYASALPIAITWVLLWNPPEGSQILQFAYLTAVAMLVRVSISVLRSAFARIAARTDQGLSRTNSGDALPFPVRLGQLV